MPVEFIVGFATILLLLAVIAEPVANKLGLPHSSVLVVLGIVSAYTATQGFDIDTGLRSTNFHQLVFFIFLPVLIFEAAYNLPQQTLRENIWPIMFLAIIGMLFTTGTAALLLYFGIDHATGFPWMAALLAGALLAATDPVAVVAQLKSLGAPKRLEILLEGESLFNDATAIVLFGIFLSLATMSGSEVTVSTGIIEFSRVFLGGSIVGLIFGFIGARLSIWLEHKMTQAIITITIAYGSFLIAESALQVSGVMATLVAGLMLARVQVNQESKQQIDFLWGALAYIANGSIFLLMGVTVTLAMFTDRWLAMLIAIGAIVVARTLATFAGLGLINLTLSSPISMAYQSVLVWGGLRGAVTLALALSLPVELEYWFTIQSMAFGVVLFTLFIQAPTMPWLLSKTKLVNVETK